MALPERERHRTFVANNRRMTRHSSVACATPAALVGLCVVLPSIANAQTVGVADLLAPIGATYTTSILTGSIPWDTVAGANADWPYAWITVDTTDTEANTLIEPAQAPDITSYPSAEHVLRSVSGANNDYVIHHYIDDTGAQLRDLGSVGPVLSYVYQQPGVLYTYPMQLGDTVSGAFCYHSDGLGVQYHYCGHSYVTFDALGTLSLPYGTLHQVKHLTRWNSSLNLSVPGSDSTYAVNQEWYVPGVPFAVLRLNVFLEDNSIVVAGGRMLNADTFAAIARLDEPGGWRVGPNPASDVLHVTRTRAEAPGTVELLTADGRVLHAQALAAGATGVTLPLSGIAAGTYLLRATMPTGTFTRQVVVVH